MPSERHDSRRAIVAALAANLGIAVLKFVAFVVTHSSSMLSESIHSVADTGDQGLLLIGRARARRPADEQHPFGYGSLRYFYAFIVAFVLFSLGGMFSIYEGVDKLRHPHELESVVWAIGVLLGSMVMEGLSFRTAVREAGQVRPAGESWWQFIRHTKSPDLPVVLLEDSAALVGLVIAHIYFAVRPDKWWITKAMLVGWITRRQYLEHHDPQRWAAGPGSSKKQGIGG